jgi:hypothetical protein
MRVQHRTDSLSFERPSTERGVLVGTFSLRVSSAFRVPDAEPPSLMPCRVPVSRGDALGKAFMLIDAGCVVWRITPDDGGVELLRDEIDWLYTQERGRPPPHRR